MGDACRVVGAQFVFFDGANGTGNAVSQTCSADCSSCAYDVGASGSCALSEDVAGKAALTGMYQAFAWGGMFAFVYIWFKFLFWKGAKDIAAGGLNMGPEGPITKAALESLTEDQHAAVMFRQKGSDMMGRGGENTRQGLRGKLEHPALAGMWVGLGIVVAAQGGAYINNLQQNTMTLSESNAVSDVSSVTQVIMDICMFFEDGMMVLIGAAVGAGDSKKAGLLCFLGYSAGALTGILGGLVGTAAAMSDTVLGLVVPAPLDQGDCELGSAVARRHRVGARGDRSAVLAAFGLGVELLLHQSSRARCRAGLQLHLRLRAGDCEWHCERSRLLYLVGVHRYRLHKRGLHDRASG